MGANITWQAEHRTVLVEEYGEVSDHDFNTSIAEIRRICEEKNGLRVLVDTTRQVRETNTATTFHRGVHAATTLRIPKLRLAIVVSEQLREQHQFFETVAVNRGFSVRVFSGIPEAMAWLADAQAD